MPSQPKMPTPADLEDTAELPTLPGGVAAAAVTDPLSATDAWLMDASLNAAAHERALGEQTRETPRPDGLQQAEIGALRSDLASAAESRSQLERNLRGLTANLLELERLLNHKSDQLSVYEREVGTRERRIGELGAQLTATQARLGEAEAQRDAARIELEQTREVVLVAQASLRASEVASNVWQGEREQQLRRLHDAETDLAHARAFGERYREALQDLEGRRHLYETMLAEREAAIAEGEVLVREREARIASLEHDIAERTRHSGAREEQLLTALDTQKARARELEAALAASRVERDAVQAQADSAAAAARASAEAAARAAQTSADAAASAAQERIAALDAQLQAQSTISQQLRAEVGAARDTLEQRNALIARLEAEAASSAAVLGNIQQNMQRFGAEEQPRMLVRTEGETGIVQLLGRRTTIGRTPDNDLRIEADFVSRHHAVVLLVGAKSIIEDLNSTNGTYVNGERVGRRTLKEGDLVTVGKTEFRFVIKPSAERAG